MKHEIKLLEHAKQDIKDAYKSMQDKEPMYPECIRASLRDIIETLEVDARRMQSEIDRLKKLF